jgi:hypothetical protein
MSAAIADDVAKPAAKTNDKATLFIICPFAFACLRYASRQRLTDPTRNVFVRGLERY